MYFGHVLLVCIIIDFLCWSYIGHLILFFIIIVFQLTLF